MKEKELQYYYPYRIDQNHNYRFLQEKINSSTYSFDNDPFDNFLNRVSDNVEEVSIYFSDDFSNWSLWNRMGRNIFSFSQDLLLMLEKTDIDNISYDMFNLPYDNFYLSLRTLGLSADSEQKSIIDGVYVHLERSEMEGVSQSKRLLNSEEDEELDYEYNLLIYFHFAGDFDEIVREKPDDVVFFEGSMYSWSYALSFPVDEEYVTVGDAIEREIEKFERELSFNYPDDLENQVKLLNSHKIFVKKTIRVLVNSLLYLSQPKDKLAINKEYPINLPHNYNRKFNIAKTGNDKLKVEKKISETGFSKILFFDYDKHKTVSEYTDYHKKSTHWRRGHWRKQSYSNKLQKTRMIWIRPILVNKANNDELPKGHVYDVNNQ